jgi:hypothetical protein
MLSIMIICSRTREPVYTGIETDEPTFARIAKILCRTACSVCGREHLWTNRQAWLTTGGWLSGTEAATEPTIGSSRSPSHQLETGPP